MPIDDPYADLMPGLTPRAGSNRRTEPMMTRVLPDVPRLPVMQKIVAPRLAHWRRVREVLATGWTTEPEPQELVGAAIGHAIGFGTWQSLVRQQGLDEGQAVETMVTLVRALASGHHER